MRKSKDEFEESLTRRTVVTLPCRLGLHARTASRFVLFTQRFQSKIRVQRGRIVADGKSILAEGAVQEIESFFSDRGHCADDA